jgi:hypothetical protein
MSSVGHLIGGAFAHQTAPFALHQLDTERAAKYLLVAVEAKITWADAEDDIRQYLKARNCSPSFIDEEIARAKPMLEPWLS